MGKSSISVLSVPEKRIDLIGGQGQVVSNVNAFGHFLSIVLESSPQKTKAEVVLVHSIRTKLDDLVTATTEVDAKKNGEAASYPPVNFEMENAELQFIKTAFENLQRDGKIVGSGWFYLVDAIENAKPKPEPVKAE